jgi:hypothetical protein
MLLLLEERLDIYDSKLGARVAKFKHLGIASEPI